MRASIVHSKGGPILDQMANKNLAKDQKAYDLELERVNTLETVDEVTQQQVAKQAEGLKGYVKFGETFNFAKLSVSILAGKEFKTLIVDSAAEQIEELLKEYNATIIRLRKTLVVQTFES
jgi:hypothetical protein